MKFSFFSFIALLIFLLSFNTTNAQQLKPEDVLHTIGQYQLKYKHAIAYIAIETEGEDPALLNNQTYIQELTKELLEEFAETPRELLSDLDEYYSFMTMNGEAAKKEATQNFGTETQDKMKAPSNPDFNPNTVSGQWQQLLSGSVLSYTTTQSYDGLFVQSSQYLHLCPGGVFSIYESSAGGGDVGGIGISNPNQMKFAGSGNWDIVEQNGVAYFKLDMQGASQLLPIKVVEGKIMIQGLAYFNYHEGAAQCN